MQTLQREFGVEQERCRDERSKKDGTVFPQPMKTFALFVLCGCLIVLFCSSTESVTQRLNEQHPTSSPALTLAERAAVSLLDKFQSEDVKVGLLIPREGEVASQGSAARRGAELAIAEANANGGFRGHAIRLVVRADDGSWGKGSKNVARLVFEDGVLAILGGMDSRSAHLAEQIAAKGRVVLVSPWASDPTLTQINIPWFFRCVPDDRQQAKTLVREIFQKRKLERIAVGVEEEDDAKGAAATFSQIATAAGHLPTLQFTYGGVEQELNSLLDMIERARIEGLMLFGSPKPTGDLVDRMRSRSMQQAIFGPLSLADEGFFRVGRQYQGPIVVISPGYRHTLQGESFQREFRRIYGRAPSALAAYAYDGMSLIVQAIREAGLDREKIRDIFAHLDYSQGATGSIQFDAKGNRVGHMSLIDLSRAQPGRHIECAR